MTISREIRAQLVAAQQALSSQLYGEALEIAIKILDHRPKDPNALRILGLAMLELGEKQGADLLTQAAAISLSLTAQESDLHLKNEGLTWASRCLIEAAEAYQKLNDHVTAKELFKKSLVITKPSVDHYLKVTEALCQVENYQDAYQVLLQAERKFPNTIEIYRAFGRVHEGLGDRNKAIQAYSAICALIPSDHEALSKVQSLLNINVPTWHFPMMNDIPRNRAYRQAIEARVTPDTRVLDIGCGGGLLSLISARAGAKAVYACESEIPVAQVAMEVMQHNELDDVIRIIPKRSTAMRIGVDLPEKLDMLVCEIFDVSLLGEDALNTIQDAKLRLLKKDAQIVPCGARVWCQLVESDELRARYHVDYAEGFDLSAFNQLRDPRVLQLDLRRFKYTPLTEPTLAITFDFEGDFSQMGESLLNATVIQSGRADGFIFWYDLILDPSEEHVMSTSPHVEGTHWMQGFAPCYQGQQQLNLGDLTHFMCAYRRFLLWFSHL